MAGNGDNMRKGSHDARVEDAAMIATGGVREKKNREFRMEQNDEAADVCRA